MNKGYIWKRQIHDEGTKVYLHTYNNENKIIKKTVLSFESTAFRVGGAHSPDWAEGLFQLRPKCNYVYIAKLWKRPSAGEKKICLT